MGLSINHLATRRAAWRPSPRAQAPHFARLERAADRGVTGSHDLLESTVYFLLGPAQALKILRPFKIAHRDTARVSQDIRNDWDAALLENLVCFRERGCVRGFDDHLGANFARHVVG